jgi:hypothetical protein
MSGVMVQVDVGPQAVNAGDGAALNVRGGKTGDAIVSEYQGRFYELNYRGLLYSGGMTLTAITNATYTSATTGVTATPVAGIYNPLSSGVNCSVLMAKLSVTLTALQATGAGPFVWMVNTNQSLISTGATPFNRSTLQQFGSKVRNMANAALTGMTGVLTIMGASSLNGGAAYNASILGTAIGLMPTPTGAVEYLDGSIIVPPGGVLALMATTTPVAHSAASTIIWSESPV